MEQQHQNFILEVINGSVAIATFFFLIWCATHLYYEFKQRKLTWYFAIVGLPSVAIVVAMFDEKLGMLISRSVIWAWRVRGGTDPLVDLESLALVTGATITAIGLLWMIAILSRPRFGEMPWRIAAGVTICYAFFAIFFHYWF